MKTAKEWTNELDQEARQPKFYDACLYLVGKIQEDARAEMEAELKAEKVKCVELFDCCQDLKRIWATARNNFTLLFRALEWCIKFKNNSYCPVCEEEESLGHLVDCALGDIFNEIE